jgi:hypothetical protein
VTYTAQSWVDNDPVNGRLNAARLNHIESGVLAANNPVMVSALPSLAAADDGALVWLAPAAGQFWLCRYNAASASAHKFEVIGGASIWQEIDAQETRSSGAAYGDLTTAGPSVTLPYPGDWRITYGVTTSSTNGGDGFASLSVGGAAPSASDAITGQASPSAGTAYASVARERVKVDQAASTVIKLQYQSTAGTAVFRYRWLRATPIRLG